jgi:hypothetical protein
MIENKKLILDFLQEVIDNGCNTKLINKAKEILEKIKNAR